MKEGTELAKKASKAGKTAAPKSMPPEMPEGDETTEEVEASEPAKKRSRSKAQQLDDLISRMTGKELVAAGVHIAENNPMTVMLVKGIESVT